MKYYRFFFFFGHCGRGNSTEIVFAIKAENMTEAIKKARMMPSVKHTRLPLMGKEITKQEYNNYIKVSAYKRYPSMRR